MGSTGRWEAGLPAARLFTKSPGSTEMTPCCCSGAAHAYRALPSTAVVSHGGSVPPGPGQTMVSGHTQPYATGMWQRATAMSL